mgnify:CR=1 FL=1
MIDIIYEGDIKALMEIEREKGYIEGYRESLEHCIYGIQVSGNKNKALESIQEMVKQEIWVLSLNNRRYNGR